MSSTLKFRSDESMLILKAISKVLMVRKNMSNLDAIRYCTSIFTKNKRVLKILVAIKKEIEEGMLSSDAFEKFGLLSEVETAKYKSYKDERHEIIKKIIEQRAHLDRFEPPFKRLFRRVLFVLVVAVVGIYFSQDFLIEKMSDYLRSKGVHSPIEQIPFFIKDTELNLLILGVFFGVSYGISWVYRHYYKNERNVVYKYFPIKQYDDLPGMFETMFNYHRGIKQTNKVFLQMSILKPYRGLENMFKDLDEATRDIGSTYSEVFERYNFSKEITEFIAIIDDKDILSNFNEVSLYAKEIGVEKFEKFSTKINAIAEYIPYFLFAVIFGVIAYYMGALDYSLDISSIRNAGM